jgi:hypothetical protein
MRILHFFLAAATISTPSLASAEEAITPDDIPIQEKRAVTTLKPTEEKPTIQAIDIPVDKPSETTTIPCENLPAAVTPSQEFIENNADDDSDIDAEIEVEGQTLINEDGEIGYPLDKVPAELLEEKPFYTQADPSEFDDDINAALDEIYAAPAEAEQTEIVPFQDAPTEPSTEPAATEVSPEVVPQQN